MDMIDWDILARQMSFFMEKNNPYAKYLMKHNVPGEIYGEGVNISYAPDLADSRGWVYSGQRKGWYFDNEHPDLGPVNGPSPLTELTKALYMYTAFMIAHTQPRTITEDTAADRHERKSFEYGLDGAPEPEHKMPANSLPTSESVPYEHKRVPENDSDIARICLRFLLKKGVHFSCPPEDIYQGVYEAFANARKMTPNMTEKDLFRIAFNTIRAVQTIETRDRQIIATIKAEKMIPRYGYTFGGRLKLMRIEKGLTQDALGAMLDVTSAAVRNWELNSNLPIPATMKKLAEIFDTTTCYLMTGMSEDEIMNISIDDEDSPE